MIRWGQQPRCAEWFEWKLEILCLIVLILLMMLQSGTAMVNFSALPFNGSLGWSSHQNAIDVPWKILWPQFRPHSHNHKYDRHKTLVKFETYENHAPIYFPRYRWTTNRRFSRHRSSWDENNWVQSSIRFNRPDFVVVHSRSWNRRLISRLYLECHKSHVHGPVYSLGLNIHVSNFVLINVDDILSKTKTPELFSPHSMSKFMHYNPYVLN